MSETDRNTNTETSEKKELERKKTIRMSQVDETLSIDSSPKILLESNEKTHNNEKWLEIKNVKRNYWKAEEEALLKEWADKAQCYEWMHFKTHEKYKRQNTWYTIPVIIISTITGTANFAQDRFGEKYKDYIVMGVGSANILAGIITTIYQYLKIAELNESHKIAYSEWGKLYRNIKTELRKHPFDRDNHTLIMKYCKKEFDRLIDSSPSIPKDIVKIFNIKHKNSNIIKPEICNSVNETEIYNMDDIERQEMIDELNEDNIAEDQLRDEQIVLLSKQLSDLTNRYKNLQNDYNAKISEINKKTEVVETIEEDINLTKFKKSFSQLNGRLPTESEINTLYNEIYLIDNAETINLLDESNI